MLNVIFLLCLGINLLYGTSEKILKEIETYLNLMPTLTASLQQKNPDGTVVKGSLWMDRQNKKLRLYYPDSGQEIISKNKLLYFKEHALAQVDSLDVDYTPAGLLLQKRIRFNKDVYLLESSIEGEYAHLALSQTKTGDQGKMILSFKIEPFIKLLGWVIIDPQGSTTHVVLDDVQGGILLHDKDFEFSPCQTKAQGK